MEKVTGVGGIFFRAADPGGLADWYEANLGVSRVPSGPEGQPWVGEGGVTVFSPFAEDTDYFPSDRQFMVNFRVRDLDAMVAQLRGAGIEVFNESTMEGIGRFAHLSDPEGNRIELWEPAS